MQDIAGLLPLLIILVAFYLLAIRPARKRQREAQAVLARLAPGQQVMTSSGLFATVRAVADTTVELETSPGTTSRWAKGAVARILEDGDAHGSGPNAA